MIGRLRAQRVELAHAAELQAENAKLHTMIDRYAAALEGTENDLDTALHRIPATSRPRAAIGRSWVSG